MTSALPIDGSFPRQIRSSRRGWSWTQVASLGFTVLAVAFLAVMVISFLWQSLPVWREEGAGYLTGRRWFFRQMEFGLLPMLYGTVVVSGVALLLAAPVGFGAAIFTAEILPARWRLPVKGVVELLAGIPSVVYGLLGILFLREWMFEVLVPFDPLSGDTLLTAGVLLSVMILPTVMTLSDDALRSVPVAQREAARGLGLTRLEAVWAVSLPQARRGMLAALLLGLGRAFGEGIAVFMVVGRQDNQWPANLLSLRPLVEAGQTLTSKLVGAETNIAYGDPLHWAAIVGLGLVLMTLALGVTWLGGLLMGRTDSSDDRTRVRAVLFRGLANGWSGAIRWVRTVSRSSAAPGGLSRRGRTRSQAVRRGLDRMLIPGTALCTALAVGVFALVVAAIAWRGASAVSWQFLTESIRLVGASGGVLYNILGTLILAGTALLVSVPLATGIALTHSVYLCGERWRARLWLALSTLNGVPSILFGLFGLLVFVKWFGWGKSWLAGGILLGVMIIPVVAVSLVERIRALPRRYVEAAAGLGLRRSQIVWSVILPQCAGGLVSGALLGVARAVGETAPIMFTATVFAGAALPSGIVDSPVLSLPYHIFILSQDSFDPAVGAKVWGAALVLLGLVLGLSLAALPARLSIHEEARHA